MLNHNEITQRAVNFSKKWKDEISEKSASQSFWNDFFNIFGVERRSVALYEKSVTRLGKSKGFIDLFWPGKLIIEQKSKGKDLDKALEQATDYAINLKEDERPDYIIICDFATFRFYDLAERNENKFELKELHQNIKLFKFIYDGTNEKIRDEHPINVKATKFMGKLHDRLTEVGYDGHQLEVYLVRLMFILFAEDTDIFKKDLFWDYIENNTKEDGSDLASKLAQLFQVLDTPRDKRLTNIDEALNSFEYINGSLFKEPLRIASFDKEMRDVLLQNCALDWRLISPAIFGSLFQSIMDKDARRNLGAHYTSEKNILKVIKPLFLDKLWAEFEEVKFHKKKLEQFHYSLSKLKFLDPACGSGNFLIIAYRELRSLELQILRVLLKNQQVTNIESKVWIDVDQFYGIEIDEWASKIAETAMWLIDHQMNMAISAEFSNYFARIPLNKSAKILHANSLVVNWEELVSKEELSYILGNPPFLGKSNQNKTQKEDLRSVFNNLKNFSDLDYVSAWFYKALDFIQNTSIKVGLVSTNSIVQGEQVTILWKELITKFDIFLHFVHRTFNWSNEAKSNAAVHCVIIGFASFDTNEKYIYEYENIKKDPIEIKVKRINQYLAEGSMLWIEKRRKPLCEVPKMKYGNKPTDNGNFIFSDIEKDAFLTQEPNSVKFFKKYIGSREFINNIPRWCLWLNNASPSELKQLPMVLDRIEKTKQFRLKSTAKPTVKSANTPSVFFYISHTDEHFLVIPETSSARRKYIPFGYMDKNTIASNALYVIPNAGIFIFGLLCSNMHMVWVQYIGGKLKSDYRYSASIVYNTYPFPKGVTQKQKERVEKAAQKVLDIRAEFPENSLADLYDSKTMPPSLTKAHIALDKTVDLCYRSQKFVSDRNRIEFLFNLYTEYTQPLDAAQKKVSKKRKKKK